MRRFVVPLLCLALSGSIFASDWATSEGSCYGKGNLSVGGGLSIGYLGAFVSADYGIHDAISIGGATGYNGYGYVYGRSNYIPVYVRGAFHPFNLKVLADKVSIRNKLDPYIGLAAGWTFGWYSNLDNGYSDHLDFYSPVREYIGVKFYPKGNLYLVAEEAGGLSWINFGVGYKF